jgi:hypothetical protein
MNYEDWEVYLIRQQREFVFTAIESDFPYLMQPFLREKWEELKKKVLEATV